MVNMHTKLISSFIVNITLNWRSMLSVYYFSKWSLKSPHCCSNYLASLLTVVVTIWLTVYCKLDRSSTVQVLIVASYLKCSYSRLLVKKRSVLFGYLASQLAIVPSNKSAFGENQLLPFWKCRCDNIDCSEVKTETNIKNMMIQSTKLVLPQGKVNSYTIQNQQIENEHVHVLREIATNLQRWRKAHTSTWSPSATAWGLGIPYMVVLFERVAWGKNWNGQ